MFENEARLRELGRKAAEGAMSEEEFAELAGLAKAKREAKAERGDVVARMRETVAANGITVHDLYAAADIVAVAKSLAASKKGPKTDSTRSRRSGAVLIEMDSTHTKGAPVRYCKGQALPNYVPLAFKKLDDGNLEANLARFTTDEGRAHFATAEGARELARWMKYIKNRQVNVKYRDAPANAA
jgi:hypothetical protein